MTVNSELATLGGGCFWCLDAVFSKLKGVSQVVSGYAGGHDPNPNYRSVCSGSTGHAEVVQVTFDPSVISFKELLEVFFTMHDPTTLNRQGADVGTQYRSIVLYHDDKQKEVTLEVIKTVNDDKWYPQPVVTQVVPLEKFYAGESYHQDYYENNPYQGYCRAVIAPKVAKLRAKFLNKLSS